MSLREAAQQALEAKQVPLIELLESVPADARMVYEHGQFHSQNIPVGRLCHEAVAALRTALAEPEQEPVACVTGAYAGHFTVVPTNPALVLTTGMALYTHPPQRKPLTDEEIRDIAKQYALGLAFPYNGPTTPELFARAIERAHGIGGEA
jgi:hypothetical protein